MGDFQNSVNKLGKKIRTVTPVEWIEISFWGLTLIVLIVFAIIAGTETADTVATIGFMFAVLLIHSLVLTVGIRYAKSKKQKISFNKRRK